MTTALVPYGLSRHQLAALITWARRKDQYGPSGIRPDRLAARRHAIQQRTHCFRNHKFRDGSYYLTPKGLRKCKACRAIATGHRAWTGLLKQKAARLRRAMIASHPDKGGSAGQFLHARQKYLERPSARASGA